MSGSELQKAVDRLMKKETGWEAFKAKPEKGGKPASRSVGRPGSSQAASSGGVITEDDYDARERYDAHTVVTSDHMFSIEYKPIKSISDVKGPPHTFKEPTS